MSFYRLPHPWNPGYVIPDYVRAEPPERGVFVTNWLPRGTIPTLIPDYLASPVVAGSPSDDLGSLGSSSLRGGCFDGDSLGATRYELQPLGSSANVVAYGQKAAKAILGHIARVPASRRAAALQSAMKTIDPTLPARTAKHVAAARKRGMHPAAALQQGLATAVSQGMVGELTKMGKSRSMPQPSSLLGLGLSRRSALGAVNFAATDISLLTPSTDLAFHTVMQVICQGFSWVNGAWVRTKVGATDIPGPPGGCPGVVVSAGGQGVAPVPSSTAQMRVGPWLFPSTADGTSFTSTRALTAEEAQLVVTGIAKATQQVFLAAGQNITGMAMKQLSDVIPGASGQIPLTLVMGGTPIFKARHPVTNDRYAVLFKSDGNLSSPRYTFTWTKTQTIWDSMWDGLVELVAAIVDAVVAAVEAVADLTCQLLASPNAATAATAAGGPAAGAGAAIAGKLCSGGGAPPPPPPASGMGWILPVALGAGALVLVLAMRQ